MSTNPTLAIEATGLVKAFGETRAVDGVDLAMATGSRTGIFATKPIDRLVEESQDDERGMRKSKLRSE